MAENKMEQVAALFGKKLGERFTVNLDGHKIDCIFLANSFKTMGADNLYVDIDAFVLMDLLTGYAEVVDDEQDG